jgi:hypothetical protein
VWFPLPLYLISARPELSIHKIGRRNYPRLEKIEAAYDPYDLFIVPVGVRSEFWDSEGMCTICRRTLHTKFHLHFLFRGCIYTQTHGSGS